ncbi:unnamed protein product [Camellia sinensis]
MLPRWSRAVTYLSRVSSHKNNMVTRRDFHGFSCRSYSKVAAATATEEPIAADSAEKGYVSTPEDYKPSYCQPGKPKQITWLMCAEYQSTLFQQVNLNKMFWSKPCSLALAPDSPLKVEEPKYEGIRYIFLKLMLFYSKQSKSIRGANVVYRRIISQVDKPAIYNVFSLEKTFKTTFSLLVLHMWLCLHRLKQEANEGVEFGQYLYEIYNHDVELRVSRAGVNLLLTRWMKDLEKIFYGNVVAYDAALLPEAKQHELENVLWRNVFSDDGSSIPNDAGQRAVQVIESSIYWASCTSRGLSFLLHAPSFLIHSYQRKLRREGIGMARWFDCIQLVFRGYVKICSQGVFLLLLNWMKLLIGGRLFVPCARTSVSLMVDKEALFSGNFMFTSLENPSTDDTKRRA